MRIKFARGKQREFLKKVLISTYCPSLRALKQYGISVNYSTLKSYFNENRTLPESLFLDLCKLGGIYCQKLKFVLIEDNWGQKIGGKK